MSTDTEAAPSTPAPETEGTEAPTEQAPAPTEAEVTETESPDATASTAEATEVADEDPEPAAEVAEVAQEDPVPAPEATVDSDMDDFEAAINQTMVEFHEGDIVEGTVVSVDAEGAMVDVGYKSEGLIPTEELSIRANVDPTTIVSVGDKVEALVLNKEDDEGRLILSKKRAQYERAWGRVQKTTEAGRHRQGHRHRGGQGRSHRRHRPPRVPSGLAGRPPPGQGPRSLHRHRRSKPR